MKVSDFVALAKKAQETLKDLDYPAEHIYLVGYSDYKSTASLVFISPKYNKLDLYDRTQLTSSIHRGPLKFNFYILGPDHLTNSRSTITRDELYKSIKIYGKKPLMLNNLEYASREDIRIKKLALSGTVL